MWPILSAETFDADTSTVELERETQMRVLAVDDDRNLRSWIQKVLGEAGYQVDAAETAEEARALGLSVAYDVVLVDLDLPDRSGLSVIYALRRAGRQCPIVIMTGNDDEDVIVSGLDAGADDYLVKPVPNGVLRARIRAVMRRASSNALANDSIVCGNISLQRSTRRLRIGDGEPSLTTREFSLLEHFLARPDDVISRSDLLERVWKMRFDTATNVVDATLCRLRAKLTAAGATATLVTVRGRGYVLTSPSLSIAPVHGPSASAA